MKKVRILLADDHRIVAEGMRSLLEPEFEFAGIVEDGRTLIKAAEKILPDVIVADISMSRLNGIEAARQIKKLRPDIKIVFLTMHQDVTYAMRAFEVGASGYVLKHSASSELVTAIHAALKGQTYVSPMIAGELMKGYKNRTYLKKELISELTPRQKEVLQLLAEGHSAKEAADILCISQRTIEFHKYTIMEKLNLKTTADLIQYAIKHGIV